MPVAHADLALSCRWILPMTAPGKVLENHTVLVRDGRIADLLPTSVARERYTATVLIERPAHLLMPGMVNAAAPLSGSGAMHGTGELQDGGRVQDGALLRIAGLLSSGTTCVCSTGHFPQVTARIAAEQGLRAVIGMPIADPREYLTRALELRDEYLGHPLISTAFAPQAAASLSDEILLRVATLAAELDAAVVTLLHESAGAVKASVHRHGMRPLERFEALGLLTPALTAQGMVAIDEMDLARAERGGIAAAVCPTQAGLGGGGGAALWGRSSPLRLGLGSSLEEAGVSVDLWKELRLFAIQIAGPSTLAERAFRALHAVTSGAAAAFGLDGEIGRLQSGMWADLCCIDLQGPAMQGGSSRPMVDATDGIGGTDAAAHARMTQLVFDGGRDIVSDVWVSGRHLINQRAFTRLDWNALASRIGDAGNATINEGAP